ncbi:MAG: hypothetical protein PUP91_25825 [Rhizonema sp. PD37]|nr:hypothetical protein [Rhizonema sp. PD37]
MINGTANDLRLLHPHKQTLRTQPVVSLTHATDKSKVYKKTTDCNPFLLLKVTGSYYNGTLLASTVSHSVGSQTPTLSSVLALVNSQDRSGSNWREILLLLTVG